MAPLMSQWIRFRFLLGLGIAAIAPGVDAEQTTCPMLLTERECQDYRTQHDQAGTRDERNDIEARYTALSQERLHLCPCPENAALQKNARQRGTPQPPRVLTGRKIRM